MRGRLHRLAFWVSRCSGLFGLWRFLHRYQIVIVSIHGVMDDDDRPPWVPLRAQIPRRVFAKHVATLAKCYRFIPLREAVEMISGRRPVQPYCLVFTFDDGYRNNLTYAAPVLRRHGAPATIFLATGHVEQRRPFWFDRLDFVLQHAAVDMRRVRIDGHSQLLSGRDRRSLCESYARLRTLAKAAPLDDRQMQFEVERLAEELETECGRRLGDEFENDDWTGLVTWPEVQTADPEYVEFGSHTVDHVRLARVDRDAARDQLLRSREMIETHTGRPCRYLAYPNGSVNADVAKLARHCGFSGAVTTIEGLNRVGDDPLMLRRISLPAEVSPTELLFRVSGFWRMVLQLKQRVMGK